MIRLFYITKRLKNNKITTNNNEILKKYKTNIELEKAIKNKKIFKIDHGIYSDKEIVDPMILFSKKYENSIITMDTAFYFYNLTDIIPDKVYLATNRNSNTIKRENIIQVWVPKEKLNVGKEKIKVNGNTINIYNKERLLVELIRKRNQIPFDYYKEIINNYRKIVNTLDSYKIEQYIALYKNENTLGNIILREVY